MALQPGLEFCNFQLFLKTGIFECISKLNRSLFFLGGGGGVGEDWVVLKEGAKIFLMSPRSPYIPPPFFCLQIYSLWI
jgi:hypothetical protein